MSCGPSVHKQRGAHGSARKYVPQGQRGKPRADRYRRERHPRLASGRRPVGLVVENEEALVEDRQTVDLAFEVETLPPSPIRATTGTSARLPGGTEARNGHLRRWRASRSTISPRHVLEKLRCRARRRRSRAARSCSSGRDLRQMLQKGMHQTATGEAHVFGKRQRVPRAVGSVRAGPRRSHSAPSATAKASCGRAPVAPVSEAQAGRGECSARAGLGRRLARTAFLARSSCGTRAGHHGLPQASNAASRPRRIRSYQQSPCASHALPAAHIEPVFARASSPHRAAGDIPRHPPRNRGLCILETWNAGMARRRPEQMADLVWRRRLASAPNRSAVPAARGTVQVSGRITMGACRPLAPCTVMMRTSSRSCSMSRLIVDIAAAQRV